MKKHEEIQNLLYPAQKPVVRDLRTTKTGSRYEPKTDFNNTLIPIIVTLISFGLLYWLFS